jgi:iron(III) transport system ATP-binding protein
MTTVSLQAQGLVKVYEGAENGARAVNDVSFEVEEGQFFTLLGPSGCGKTTTLRAIAGLERTDDGTITLDGRVVQSRSPKVFVRSEDRDVGMVFQSYAIWPHMTVYDNVAFPLKAANRRRRRIPRGNVRAHVMDVLEKVQLNGYEKRMASKLSGGQQQRLALARALGSDPKILLLDEPLSNLDAGLRELMRTELRRLQRSVGVTTLYVTHDQSEALSMSNRVAVMDGGKIIQLARPREIYRRPATRFVASFVGRTNLLDATVLGKGDDGALLLETAAGNFQAVCPEGAQIHDEMSLSVRPEDVRLSVERPSHTANVVQGRIEYVLFLGDAIEYHVSVGNELLIARLHPDLEFKRREDVFVDFPVQRCVVVSDEYGTSGSTSTDEPDEGVEPLTDSTLSAASQMPGNLQVMANNE